MKSTPAHPDTSRPSLWVAFALALSVAISNGLARFAYGLVLPAMREDLSWTYSTAGLLNTANAIGYMLGAFAGYAWLRNVDPVKLFRVGLAIVVVTLCATPLHDGMLYLSAMRALTGLGAPWLFSCGAALVAFIFADDPHRRGLAVGIYFSGGGLGMIISGLALPPLLEFAGSSAWRTSWYLIGGTSAALAILPFCISSRAKISTAPILETVSDLPVRAYALPLVAYVFCGAGSNVYLTFLAAWIADRGQPWYHVTLTWCVLGLGICLSPYIWGKALNTWPATRTLGCSLLVTAAGVALSFVGVNEAVMFGSALLYGCALFIGPTAVTLLARSTRPAQEWAKIVALFTMMFSVGQTFGPWIAGAISDRWGLSYGMGLVLLLLLAASAMANGPSEARRLAREFSAAAR